MGRLRIKSETLAKRCEICHQSDRFDAIKNFCSRCSGAGDLLELTARARYLQQRLYVMRNDMIAERQAHSSWLSPVLPSVAGFYPRVVAGVWFAIAAIVPIYFILGIRFDYRTEELFIFRLMPIISAGISGLLFGNRLITTCQHGRAAILRGIGVAFFAYLLFIVGLCVISTLDAINTGRGASMIFMMPFMIFFGGVYIGWLLALGGGAAGWLLYKIFKPQRHRVL